MTDAPKIIGYGRSVVSLGERDLEICVPKGLTDLEVLEYATERAQPAASGLAWTETCRAFCPLRTSHEHVLLQLGAVP